MVGVRVSLKLEASLDFFAKDRTAPEANRFNSFLGILEMQFHRKKKDKNKQKKPQELVWKFVEKHMKTQGTKVPSPATKEDKRCFFMITKPFVDRVTRR